VRIDVDCLVREIDDNAGEIRKRLTLARWASAVALCLTILTLAAFAAWAESRDEPVSATLSLSYDAEQAFLATCTEHIKFPLMATLRLDDLSASVVELRLTRADAAAAR
jgi:hypothetical protein